MLQSRKQRVVLISIISIASLFLFAWLTRNLFQENELQGNDLAILEWFRLQRTPFLNSFFLFITNFGNWTYLLVLVGIAGIYLKIYRHSRHLVILITTTVFSVVFTTAAKLIFARPRPDITFALVKGDSFSFPSGHALLSITIYGILIFILWQILQKKWQKALLFTLGVLLIALIGISRLYLGVHWPTDVFASYLLGVCWLGLSMILVEFKPEIWQFLKAKFGHAA